MPQSKDTWFLVLEAVPTRLGAWCTLKNSEEIAEGLPLLTALHDTMGPQRYQVGTPLLSGR